MKRAIICTVMLTVGAGAQQQPVPEKQAPEARKIDVAAPSADTGRSRAPLPVIDLPEFVITGSASIDPTPADKLVLESRPQPGRPATMTLQRNRTTVDLGQRRRETLDRHPERFNGKFLASMANFFTPGLGLWFGGTSPEVMYHIGGTYTRTKGWVPNTDASAGTVEAGGTLTFSSREPLFHQAGVTIRPSYEAMKYKFYGSANPSADRSVTGWDVRSGIFNETYGPLPYSFDFGVGTVTYDDTTSSVSENRIRTRIGATTDIAGHPVEFSLAYARHSLGGAGSGSTSLLNMGAAVRALEWGPMAFVASFTFTSGTGMQGPSLMKLYANFFTTLRLDPKHTLTLGYDPGAREGSLREAIRELPYLDSRSVIRHTDVGHAGTVILSSFWDTDLQSVFSVSLRSATDYPLPADSSMSGIWTLVYTGRTTMVFVKGLAVAKIGPNDYLASSVTLTSSKNSTTGLAVPFLPALEAGCVWDHRISTELTGQARLRTAQGIETSVTQSSKLGGIVAFDLRGEYMFFGRLKAFLELRNLFDRRNERFPGYHDRPFTVMVGLEVKW